MKRGNIVSIIILSFVIVIASFTTCFADGVISKDQKAGISVDMLLAADNETRLEILTGNGLVIPEGYKEATNELYAAIDHVLNNAENGVCGNYNFTGLTDLENQIFSILGVAGNRSTPLNGLTNSTVVGSWTNAYLTYNCYGYALGTDNAINPGYYSGTTFNASWSVSQIASAVVSDLDALGYYSYYTTTKPTSLSSWERVICVRRNTSSGEYHFMRGLGVNTWQHKPGFTNILCWNYTSPAATTWTDEAYAEWDYQGVHYSGYFTNGISYNSTIYYIILWSKSGPGPSIESIDYEEQ